MKKFFLKIFIQRNKFALIAAIIFILLAPKAYSQGETPRFNDPNLSSGGSFGQAQESIDARADSQTSLEDTNQSNISETIVSLSCLLTPMETTSGEVICENGALNSTAQNIVYLATVPPVQTGQYVADLMNNFGLAQPAYAQGIGFASLTPVLPLWKAFRNIAYFMYILIFLAIGFMIMFRYQINPQTVVTLQSALPKMVVTLLLITFSYAIAGFVVDLIYLSIFIATALLGSFGIIENLGQTRDILFGHNVLRIAISYFITPHNSASTDAASAIGSMVSAALGLGGLGGAIFSILAYLIIAVAILVALFRTLFSLIMAYLGIILSTVFAPLRLMTNAFPGSNSFTTWIRGLVANAAVFPAVALMLIIGAYLSGGGGSLGIRDNNLGDPDGAGFIPPLMVGAAERMAGSGSIGITSVGAIIGLGILLLLPEVPNLVRGALGVQEDRMGAMAMQGLRAGMTPVRAVGGLLGFAALTPAGQTLSKAGWQRYQKWSMGRKTAQSGPQPPSRPKQQGTFRGQTRTNAPPPASSRVVSGSTQSKPSSITGLGSNGGPSI